jgi:4-O-beta-D-mannosyl-D-glucose phosphorylase
MDIMDKMDFKYRLNEINKNYEQLISIKNTPLLPGNGIFLRYKNPVLTAAHTPPFWRYDLNPKTNKTPESHKLSIRSGS